MLTDLLNTTAFTQARKQDATSIFSSQATLHFFGKSLSTHLLSGNFGIHRLAHLHNDHISLNLTAFLPQRDDGLIQSAQTAERHLNNEGFLDISEGQCTRPKTSLQMIGAMVEMRFCFCPLCQQSALVWRVCRHEEGEGNIC